MQSAGKGEDKKSKAANNNTKSERDIDEMKKDFEEMGWKVVPGKPKDNMTNNGKGKATHHLNTFQTIEPEAFNAAKCIDGWEEVDFAIDSGATETVVGEDMLMRITTKEGPACKRGVE